MTLPQTMRGMVLTGHGGLEKLEWREDLAVPNPGADEVLIRVAASSVNNTDINTRTGWYSKSVRGDTASGATQGYGAAADADGGWSGVAFSFPRIQGADCCGEIVAAGAAVPAARIGERVLVRALQSTASPGSGPATATFGSECDGAFADYALARSEDAIAVRSDLSDVELASFPCAFSTAEGMVQRGGLGAERVLITGASGGVGSAAIQLAKRRGAEVTALTSASKADELRALGADVTLDRDAPLPEHGFDIVLDLVGGPRWPDLVGGPRWPDLIDALCDGGRYVTAGAIAGPIVELDLRTLYLRDLSFFGCTHQPANVFTDLVRYIEAGEIRPTVAQTYGLADLRAAQEAFLTKSHVGKIGIRVHD
ncbi:alcohol dehydrogenase family protein [Pelagibius sp.]|uniref:alcohol dehydrogenase family protein n=1 Tax=Pelagibius sp. TaxID=1931238 RepID=UPI00260217DA|nr:alcohol dehydrogenase family protein [Pelagibius sp.]